MADSTTPIQQIAAAANWEKRVNENFDAASPAMIYGRNAATTSGLTWGYVGGRWGGFSISSGTVALTLSTTNYVVVAKASGAVSVSTSTTNWNNTTDYVRAYKIVTGASQVTSYEDHRGGPGGSQGGAAGGVAAKEIIAQLALSDLTTSITTGTSKGYFRPPFNYSGLEIRASLLVSSSSGTPTVDMNVNGSTVLSTKLTIDASETTSVTAATAAVFSSTTLTADDLVTFDVDTAGTGAKGLIVTLVGNRA